MDDTDRCKSDSCRKKAKTQCLYNMCFGCCSMQPQFSDCIGHADSRRKNEDNERYLNDGIQSTKKKIRFVHPEEKFEDYNQTVTIWCLSEFLKNKKWCEDTFVKLGRTQRQKMLTRKRKPEGFVDFSQISVKSEKESDQDRDVEQRKEKVKNVQVEKLHDLCLKLASMKSGAKVHLLHFCAKLLLY